MAQDYEINLKVNTGSSTSDLNDLESALSGISDEIVPLTSQMGEMEDKLMLMAYAGDTTSAEFQRLSLEVAGMRATIRDTDAGLEALSMTTTQKVSGAISGAASGFEAFQGAMGAFGVESEAVEAALLKVQSAMALTQGIQGIKEALPSFTALKTGAVDAFSKMTTAGKAFALTGIGLVVTAIGTAIVYLDDLKAAFKSTTLQQDVMNDAQLKAVEIASEELDALDKLKVTINSENVSRKDKAEAIKKLQADYPNLLANVDAEESSITELNKAIKLNSELVMLRAEAEALATIRTAAYKEKIEEQIKSQTKQNESITSWGLNLLGYTEQAQALDDAYSKKAIKNANDRIAAADAESAKIQQRINDKINEGATDESWVNKQQELEEKREKQRAAAEEKRKERAAAYKQWVADQKSMLAEITKAHTDYENSKKSEEEQEVIASQEKWDTLIANATTYKLDSKQLLLDKEDEEKAIRQKYADEAIALEKEKQDALNLLIKEAANQQLQEREDFDALYYEATTSAQQQELDAVGEKYFYLIETAKQYGLDTAQLETDRLTQEAEINKKYADEKKAAQDLIDQQELEARQLKNNLITQSAYDTFTTLGNLTTLFAGKSEKAQKRAFQVQKAVSIAQAVIDTYKAANVALASSPPPFNYIAMAAAITTGLVNVKTIMAQKFEGTGTTGGDTTTPSSAGGGTTNVMTPNFNVVGNSGLNQLAQVAGQPIQAYVVSGQITTAQSLDRNKIENATL